MRLVDGACGPRQRSVKGPLRVERDRLDALVGDQVLDQLDLVVLALGLEALDRLGDRQLAALEVLVGLDVLAHLLLDARQVVLGQAHALREVEVVVEAVLDRRADRDLHARVELHHRGREHVGGVVADEPERVGAVARGHDLDALAVVQRRVEVAQLGRAAVVAGTDAERRAREPLADRARGVGAGGAVGQLERGAVWERDLHRGLTVPDAWRSARLRTAAVSAAHCVSNLTLSGDPPPTVRQPFAGAPRRVRPRPATNPARLLDGAHRPEQRAETQRR